MKKILYVLRVPIFLLLLPKVGNNSIYLLPFRIIRFTYVFLHELQHLLGYYVASILLGVTKYTDRPIVVVGERGMIEEADNIGFMKMRMTNLDKISYEKYKKLHYVLLMSSFATLIVHIVCFFIVNTWIGLILLILFTILCINAIIDDVVDGIKMYINFKKYLNERSFAYFIFLERISGQCVEEYTDKLLKNCYFSVISFKKVYNEN